MEVSRFYCTVFYKKNAKKPQSIVMAVMTHSNALCLNVETCRKHRLRSIELIHNCVTEKGQIQLFSDPCESRRKTFRKKQLRHTWICAFSDFFPIFSRNSLNPVIIAAKRKTETELSNMCSYLGTVHR